MELSELKPCPFCGGKAEYFTTEVPDGVTMYPVAYIECQQCLAQTGFFSVGEYYGMKPYTKEEICDRWNRRA